MNFDTTKNKIQKLCEKSEYIKQIIKNNENDNKKIQQNNINIKNFAVLYDSGWLVAEESE